MSPSLEFLLSLFLHAGGYANPYEVLNCYMTPFDVTEHPMPVERKREKKCSESTLGSGFLFILLYPSCR